MKTVIVLGTRPEIIKLSPLIRGLEQAAADFLILHTGQHYSPLLDRVFFTQLALPSARYNLGVGSGSHGAQTGKMLMGIEAVLQTERPDVVVVEGDTNSTLAGALAAVKLGIPVAHVEAGLRSYDRAMPEEINRILVDHCADLLCAPTATSRQNLRGEGIPADAIVVTGNPIVDAVHWNLPRAPPPQDVLRRVGVAAHAYFLATVHRQENVDHEDRFRRILQGLELVGQTFGSAVLYPIHPRARKQVERFQIPIDGVRLIDPVDYWSFLQLERHARLVLTDSGGVQEETCILRVPCVTLRDNTERPETLDVGSNVLAGATPQRIVEHTARMLRAPRAWPNPFGDGRAGDAILKVLTRTFGDGRRARQPGDDGL